MVKNRSKKLLSRFTFTTLVSKVIEKVIHNQTENFLNKNKILCKYQSGFHKSFSTNSCLTLLTDKIIGESGKYTGLILINFKKKLLTQ